MPMGRMVSGVYISYSVFMCNLNSRTYIVTLGIPTWRECLCTGHMFSGDTVAGKIVGVHTPSNGFACFRSLRSTAEYV